MKFNTERFIAFVDEMLWQDAAIAFAAFGLIELKDLAGEITADFEEAIAGALEHGGDHVASIRTSLCPAPADHAAFCQLMLRAHLDRQIDLLRSNEVELGVAAAAVQRHYEGSTQDQEIIRTFVSAALEICAPREKAAAAMYPLLSAHPDANAYQDYGPAAGWSNIQICGQASVVGSVVTEVYALGSLGLAARLAETACTVSDYPTWKHFQGTEIVNRMDLNRLPPGARMHLLA